MARASAREVRQARRDFQRLLQTDRRQWVQEAGATIEALMESRKIQEAWDCIYQWYYQVKVRQPPPSRETLDQATTERAELYICRPPEDYGYPFWCDQRKLMMA